MAPWNASEFKSKHNKSLSKPQARRASKQANAVLRETGDEGMAIAVANKNARKGKGVTPPPSSALMKKKGKMRATMRGARARSV